MRILLLADIHGNFPALQAVLEDIPPVEAVICCGDLVGYYPDVNEVCTQLRDINAHVIRGNHDAYVTAELIPDPDKKRVYMVDWTRSTLHPSHLKWLVSLPLEIRFQWKDLKIIVRHASPWDEETYLYVDSPDLSKVTLDKNEILALGHTHYPMTVNAGEGVIVNPGSVGQPRDWNPLASYAVIDTSSFQIENRRVWYSVSEFQKRLRSQNWDERTINILNRNRFDQ